jgi:uncharacterized protein YerC
MPHVSSKKINEKIYHKIFSQLANVVSQTQSHQAEALLMSILTETEQMMLSKRLAAAVMYSEGYSPYTVTKTLVVSPSTAARLHLAYEVGAYNGVLDILKKDQKQKEEFWTSLEVLLRLGMPSMGKDRWKHLR